MDDMRDFERVWIGPKGFWGFPKEGATEYVRADILAATLAANAALVQRLEEARGLVELAMPQLWHDATLVRARAFLAGGAA